MGFFSSLFFWIFVLVASGLVISFILDPSSFDRFKTRINDLMPDNPIHYSLKDSRLVKANVFCSMLETANLREQMCDITCSVNRSSYLGYDCLGRDLVCYCVN